MIDNSEKKKRKLLKYAYRKFLQQKILLAFVIIFTIILIVSLFVYVKTKKEINLKKKFYTALTNKLSYIGNKFNLTYFLSNNKKLIIKGDKIEVDNENNYVANDCIINIDNIRNKIYSGPTETILLDKSNNFNIPKKTILTNNNNYIIFNELSGAMKNNIITDKHFQIYDEETFLEGDNAFMTPNKDYLRIDKKPHLIIDNEYKNHKFDKKYTYKKSNDLYDLTAKVFELFGKDDLFFAKNNVVIINKDGILKSNFLKAKTDRANNELKYVFLSKDVDITQKDSNIKSDYAYFEKITEKVVFYSNVFMKSKRNTTNGDFYIYEPKKDSGITFNQYTLLSKQEQKENYAILRRMCVNLKQKDVDYINFVIKANQEYINNYNLNKDKNKKKNDDKNEIKIDRSKKVKIHLSNE